MQNYTSLQEASRPVVRPIARLVIAAHLLLALQPLSVLAQESSAPPAFNPVTNAQLQRLNQWQQTVAQAQVQQARVAAASTPGTATQVVTERTARNLGRAQELLRSLVKPVAVASAARKAADASTTAGVNRARSLAQSDAQRTTELQQLSDLLDAVDADTDAALSEFNASRADLLDKRVSAEILARHDQTASDLQTRAQTLRQRIRTFKANSTDVNLAAISQFFDQYPAAKTHTALEPGKLPWSTPKPNTRQPATTKTAWYQNLYADQKVRLAQAGGTNIGGIQFNIPPEPTQTPTAADLAETAEITLTAAIRTKAAELGNNPVTIHNWVRNSIQWVPTWGAIQNADTVLQSLRGNAFDIASLEIALLRAANIPARYQFGTIDIPADKAQNWVGGTTKPEAALQLLNQGGIAAIGLAQAGVIQTIRMEHVWVSAYVNWTPSRGNRNATNSQHVNPNGPLNAWVPLDGSYKQYSYTPAMDLKTAVPLDANALLAAAQQGATVNAAEGWVQNLNQTAIQNQLADYQTRLQTYINSTATGANSTVGDVIGKQIIPQQSPTLLAGTPPYTVTSAAGQSSSIPSAMQHRFTYALSDSYGSPVLSYTELVSKLAGKRLTISYVSADQATTDLIASYLPQPHADGSPIQPSELPASLPGYLIKLKAQINLDGQAVASATQALPMGTELQSQGGFTTLADPTQWDLTSEETNVVGQATAIGISAAGISAAQLTAVKQRLQTTQNQLQASNITGLTGEQIGGEILTAALWSWFAEADIQNRLTQMQAGMMETPGLSYGLFHAVVNPIYSWGVVRRVTFPGVSMDIGHVRNIGWSRDNSSNSWIIYNRVRGQYLSVLEGVISDRFFNNPLKCKAQWSTATNAALPVCPQGVSAVRLIALASQAGQKIFTISAESYAVNPNVVNLNLAAHSQATKEKVQQALDAGYEVSIHEYPISQDGWVGAGFVVIDPSTGAGGYLIEGGANGSFLKFVGALFSDPTLLRTPCGESFLQDTIDRFIASNTSIPGLTLPTGATLLTAGNVAKQFGGMTFFQLAQFSLRNPQFLLGNITIFGLTALINNLLMGLAFEIGILVGSGISAATCREE